MLGALKAVNEGSKAVYHAVSTWNKIDPPDTMPPSAVLPLRVKMSVHMFVWEV